MDSALGYSKPQARAEGAWNLLHLIPAWERERLGRGRGWGLTIVSTGTVRSSSRRLASPAHLTDEDNEAQWWLPCREPCAKWYRAKIRARLIQF